MGSGAGIRLLGGYNRGMSTGTQELIRICEQLPEARRAEVADFARFLLARESEGRQEAPQAPAGESAAALFAEMEPYGVAVADVNDSREAVYKRQDGE